MANYFISGKQFLKRQNGNPGSSILFLKQISLLKHLEVTKFLRFWLKNLDIKKSNSNFQTINVKVVAITRSIKSL